MRREVRLRAQHCVIVISMVVILMRWVRIRKRGWREKGEGEGMELYHCCHEAVGEDEENVRAVTVEMTK